MTETDIDSQSWRLLYRAMKSDDDGAPLVARSGRALGVRIGGPYADIPVDDEGNVHPRAGGMSVTFDDPKSIPKMRRPRWLGGDSPDPLFSMSTAKLSDRLVARSERDLKALVEPSALCGLVEYEAALGSTRADWRKHDKHAS